LEYTYTQIQEGAAKLVIPELAEPTELNKQQIRSQAPVFYNPVMKMNRDSTILVLKSHIHALGREIEICEPMGGTGVRGIRAALEVNGVESVLLGDLNPSAIRLTEKNIGLNHVGDKVKARLMEANLMLSIHAKPLHRFDYIDIDPYGSPAPFIDSAVRACKKNGLVALTATDMAPLCGVYVKACIRKYGGKPQRTSYCHEQAIRLLAASLASNAARHESAAWPVFSYATDHYVRLYAHIERGAKVSNRCLNEIGYLMHCFECTYHTPTKHNGEMFCPICGAKMKPAGPLWIGKLADPDFTDVMLRKSEDTHVDTRLLNIVEAVGEEVEYGPGFYDLDDFCSRLGVASQSLDAVVKGLRDIGFNVAYSYIHNRGFKTDATPDDIDKVIRRL